jgi:hypothetical protein
MNGVSRVVRKGKKSWNDRVKDIGVVAKEGTETISEGITRLNIALRNDKRKLRSKTLDDK